MSRNFNVSVPLGYETRPPIDCGLTSCTTLAKRQADGTDDRNMSQLARRDPHPRPPRPHGSIPVAGFLDQLSGEILDALLEIPIVGLQVSDRVKRGFQPCRQ